MVELVELVVQVELVVVVVEEQFDVQLGLVLVQRIQLAVKQKSLLVRSILNYGKGNNEICKG